MARLHMIAIKPGAGPAPHGEHPNGKERRMLGATRQSNMRAWFRLLLNTQLRMLPPRRLRRARTDLSADRGHLEEADRADVLHGGGVLQEDCARCACTAGRVAGRHPVRERERAQGWRGGCRVPPARAGERADALPARVVQAGGEDCDGADDARGVLAEATAPGAVRREGAPAAAGDGGAVSADGAKDTGDD